jgi:hypothetical protein
MQLKAIPVTGHEAYRVVRCRSSSIVKEIGAIVPREGLGNLKSAMTSPETELSALRVVA